MVFRRRNNTRRTPLNFAAAVCALALIAGCGQQKPTDQLPHLGTRSDDVSVSGISSGAYMAGQFQMAHAKNVAGAAIIAGGPYGCSESAFADAMPGPGSAFINLNKAVNGCMLNLLGLWGAADASDLAHKAKARADKGDIDPIAKVNQGRVYLFSGQSDHTVVEPIVDAAANFYRKLGMAEDHIKFVKNMPAGHAFVTDNEGNACERTGEPYIVNCRYDQAGELLQHIHGKLMPRAETTSGEFQEFDQRPFVKDLTDSGLAVHGAVYVPKSCRSTTGCRVHIAFHGCAQNREQVGDAFIKSTGFARWADTNNFVILFPQTSVSAFNPQGCWDWWGYTGSNYLTRNAAQIAAVEKMLQTLSTQ